MTYSGWIGDPTGDPPAGYVEPWTYGTAVAPPPNRRHRDAMVPTQTCPHGNRYVAVLKVEPRDMRPVRDAAGQPIMFGDRFVVTSSFGGTWVRSKYASNVGGCIFGTSTGPGAPELPDDITVDVATPADVPDPDDPADPTYIVVPDEYVASRV